MTRLRTWGLMGALAAAIGCAALVVRARGAPLGSPRDRHPYLELRVPRVGEPIVINAETEGKKVWEAEAGRTGVFKDESGQGMVPYTEAKARWMPGMLYLLLYAGDLDLEGSVTSRDGPVLGDDAFHIELGREGHVYTVDVSVLGTLADADCTGAVGEPSEERRCDPRWDSHAVVAVDRDGTLTARGQRRRVGRRDGSSTRVARDGGLPRGRPRSFRDPSVRSGQGRPRRLRWLRHGQGARRDRSRARLDRPPTGRERKPGTFPHHLVANESLRSR